MEKTRIFIKDLPETVTQEDLESAFIKYGNVISVEIKKRKQLGPQRQTPFSYVTLETSHSKLRQCFMDFANGIWQGKNVSLEVARENFLDRLKKEREESKSNSVSTWDQGNLNSDLNSNVNENKEMIHNVTKKRKNELITITKEENNKIHKLSDSTWKRKKSKLDPNADITDEFLPVLHDDSNQNNNSVIQNNKDNIKEKLSKISIEEKSSFDINRTYRKNNMSTANLKRLESLKKIKKAYQNQKSLVHFALSNIDEAVKNKIIFGDIEPVSGNQKHNENNVKSNKSLFDDQSDDDLDAVHYNFQIKEQFEGKRGQKLLELQSKYKNDERFKLDKRFLGGLEDEQIDNGTNDDCVFEVSLEEEKKKEYKILEQVLGTKINSKSPLDRKIEGSTKSMLRFDPTRPEHAKYELKQEVLQNQTIKKDKKKKDSNFITNEKQQEEKEIPLVSKEVFYKVTENLKETFNQQKGFSLLNMFGTAEENEDQTDTLEQKIETKKQNKFESLENPFRYDSSDDEDEIKDIPPQQSIQTEGKSAKTDGVTRKNFWAESFFFCNDDYRLQEGFDFIEKINSEEKTEFAKVRRDLKEIVKAKVRNNQSKKKPFKRKLGGNKKRKVMRIKKALKK